MQDSINNFKMNFYNNYHNLIVPEISKFEEMRKRKLFKAVTLSSLLIIAGIVLCVLIFCAPGKKDIRLPAALIMLGLVVYATIKKNFENLLKDNVMGFVVRCFGDSVRWGHFYGNHELFKEAGAIPYYERVADDDVFFGVYKGVNYHIVESEYEKGSGKSRTTTFKGVVIKLDMNKEFSSHTIVCSDNLLHLSPISSLKRTALEDVEFEKKYDVFTNDPVDARYLLTPAFMEKLKNISLAFHCNNIKCSFYRNNLIIAISTGTDLFSIGSLVKTVVDKKQFAELLEQFMSILALIDQLELNKKLML